MTTTLDFSGRKVRIDFHESYLRMGIGTHELSLQTSVQAPWRPEGRAPDDAILIFSAHAELGPTYGRHALADIQETFRLYGHPSHQHLRLLLSDDQLVAIEDARKGGPVEILLNITATLLDGGAQIRDCQETYRVPSERWLEMLHQAGVGASINVRVTGPLNELANAAQSDDDPSAGRAVARLREARRELLDGRYEACIKTCRAVLEHIRAMQTELAQPPSQDVKKRERTQDQRWAALLDDVFGLASGASHDDEVTADFRWSQRDAQAVLAVTAGLLGRAMPE